MFILKVLFLIAFFSFSAFSQIKDSLNNSLEFRIKKLIVDDFNFIGSIFKSKSSHRGLSIIKSINIDSSSFLGKMGVMYKVKVFINCESICFGWTNSDFEYHVGSYEGKLYRMNGFYISDYFSFDALWAWGVDLVDQDLFSKKISKKINKYRKKNKFDKIMEFFYSNQFLYCNGKKLNSIFTRPIFTISNSTINGF